MKSLRGFSSFEETVRRLGKFKDPNRTASPDEQKAIDAAVAKRKRKNEKRLAGINRKSGPEQTPVA